MQDFMMFWFLKPMSEFIGSLALVFALVLLVAIFSVCRVFVWKFKMRRSGYRYRELKLRLQNYVTNAGDFNSTVVKTTVIYHGDASRQFNDAYAFDSALYDKVFNDGLRSGWLQDTGLEPEMNHLHNGKLIRSHLRVVK